MCWCHIHCCLGRLLVTGLSIINSHTQLRFKILQTTVHVHILYLSDCIYLEDCILQHVNITPLLSSSWKCNWTDETERPSTQQQKQYNTSNPYLVHHYFISLTLLQSLRRRVYNKIEIPPKHVKPYLLHIYHVSTTVAVHVHCPYLGHPYFIH